MHDLRVIWDQAQYDRRRLKLLGKEYIWKRKLSVGKLWKILEEAWEYYPMCVDMDSR